MRLENTFGFSLFKKRIHKEIAHLFQDVKAYRYIYKTDGTPLTHETLQQNPQLIQTTDLVFTNVEWNVSNL